MNEQELMSAVAAILAAAEEQIQQEAAAQLRGELAELLPLLGALIDRAERVAELRAAKGRGLSKVNQELLELLYSQVERLRDLVAAGLLG